MDIHFKLLKPFANYKKGKTFDCFGGFVCGVTNGEGKRIRFDDTEYFKMIKK